MENTIKFFITFYMFIQYKQDTLPSLDTNKYDDVIPSVKPRELVEEIRSNLDPKKAQKEARLTKTSNRFKFLVFDLEDLVSKTCKNLQDEEPDRPIALPV